MKIQWSALISVLTLATLMGCGAEEFGSVPRTSTINPDGLRNFSHNSCSQYTLIKPKVDVLYVVDNSGSANVLSNSVKESIRTTVNSLSTDFDYRVIATPLLQTDQGNNHFQVMTNSSNLDGIPSNKMISDSSQFNFFVTPQPGLERGLGRTVSFINAHKNSLIRNNSHLIIVLISNGRDHEVEGYNNNDQYVQFPAYGTRLASLRSLRTQMNSIQMRFFSVTAKEHQCKPGYWSANLSYVSIAKQLYTDSGAQDSNTNRDTYDLCGSGISNLFSGINSSIQQQVLKHEYRYSPITFADASQTVDMNQLKVFKVSPNGTSVELPKTTAWTHEDKGTPTTVNTRELPTPGEPATARHFVRFTDGNLPKYPDCIRVQSVSQTEYFGWVVLPQRPVFSSVAVRINGNLVPHSALTDETATPKTINIKVNHQPPGQPAGTANPPLMKTGFMIKLNSSHYYKSGDNVEIYYQAQPI